MGGWGSLAGGYWVVTHLMPVEGFLSSFSLFSNPMKFCSESHSCEPNSRVSSLLCASRDTTVQRCQSQPPLDNTAYYLHLSIHGNPCFSFTRGITSAISIIIFHHLAATMSTNNTNNMTCPKAAVPEPVNIGIDSNSIYAVSPRGNYTSDRPDDWMISCCEPSPVRLARNDEFGTCWEWCELPSKYTNATSDTDRLSSEFLRCLTSTARATNSSFPPTAVMVSAAPRHGVAGDLTLGLAVALAVAVWRLFM